ncbi:Glycosyltransferase involved in cell wall bisynthesis [Arthrobacter sp. yr096]|nr:Glycosyltransferase involved in cell wall bisynthesis [Arthrobacter sp. yr096]
MLRDRAYDLVHAHPFRSREIGLQLAASWGAPFMATFHGSYLDAVSTWHERAALIGAVSPAVAENLVKSAGVPAHKIALIRNGVEDELFEHPITPVQERLERGRADIVVLARMDKDKLALVESVVPTALMLAEEFPQLEWRLRIVGSGSAVGDFQEHLRGRLAVAPNISTDWMGWVNSHETSRVLSRAVLAFASGRGAAQALALGTPVVAAGSQGVVGLQEGENLQLGYWGNFGGQRSELHPGNEEIAERVIELLRDPKAWHAKSVRGRQSIYAGSSQSSVDAAYLSAVQLALEHG